ncbi:hypothetical protein LzC2_42030 [Planctomycetes bacterium LzC2]|uniref:Uncharacterized protein n=1 Tax=Alienimonas chondri TaxID=2681879 RepID=A0ABX1VIX9_9PLAN|nr:hypothetical protein [Alienimonas chondri]
MTEFVHDSQTGPTEGEPRPFVRPERRRREPRESPPPRSQLVAAGQQRRAPQQRPDRTEQPAQQRPAEFQQPVRIEQRDRHRDRVQHPQGRGAVFLLRLRDHPGGAVGPRGAGEAAFDEPPADVGGLTLGQRVGPEACRRRQRRAHRRAAVQPRQECVLRRSDPVERPGGLVFNHVEPLPAGGSRGEPQARPQLRAEFEELRRLCQRRVGRRFDGFGMSVRLHHPSHPPSFSTGR